jgi:hypothetical protein
LHQLLFKHGKEVAVRKPNVLISDDAANFHLSYKKEFFTLMNPRTRDIYDTYDSKERYNHSNKTERMNRGELGDREKVIHRLEKTR